jgi:hypothetical protein
MPLVTPRSSKSCNMTRTSPIPTQACSYALLLGPSNISYSSASDPRVPQNTALQCQNQSNWSPDAVSNITFGIAMFVLAAIGLLIQSRRCRHLALTCLRIRQEPGTAVSVRLPVQAELKIFIVSKNAQNDNTAAGGEHSFSPEEADHGMGAEMEEKIMEEVRIWLKTRFRNTECQRTSLDWKQVDVEKAEDSIKSVSRMNTGMTLVQEASEDIGCHKSFQVEE